MTFSEKLKIALLKVCVMTVAAVSSTAALVITFIYWVDKILGSNFYPNMNYLLPVTILGYISILGIFCYLWYSRQKSLSVPSDLDFISGAMKNQEI